jgi:cell wall-associated protease
MKKFLIAILVVFPTLFVHAQVQISNSKWFAHTDIPRSADLQLIFKKDSFLIVSPNGKQLGEAMIFSIHNDSLHIRKISGLTPCANETEGWYKIEWLQNGESYSFRAINDPCPERLNFFTHLKLTGRNPEAIDFAERRSYMSIQKDSVPGINLYGAYELLKGRRSQQVVVGLIGNYDVDHEDLKGVMWVNEKEISGNGIDDDKNGYVDDVRGWNFLSDKKGNTVPRLQRDVTYIYKLWKDKYDKADPTKLKPQEKDEYDIYQKAKKEWTENYEFVPAYKIIRNDSAGFFKGIKDIADHTSWEKLSWADFVAYDPGPDKFTKAVHKALQGKYFPPRDGIIFKNFIQNFPQRWQGFVIYIDKFLEFYDLDYNPTKIIGDDPLNPNEHNYGSPFFKTFTPDMTTDHDTHIAGIIGANRNNGIGIDGIADNVKIMNVQAGAGGDERDKDVANAIRYAVDNGAKVLNLSFGKRFSSHKQAVDDAIKYAEAHDVLVVHAAGNDGNDCDTADYYPQTKFKDGKFAKNVLQVGCSRTTFDSHLPAWYSNYGKHTVDLFAPGHDSYGPFVNNHYGYAGGTSNAAPFVVGVAALLKSYFPELTMLQIKNIILETTYRPNINVIRPHYIDPAIPPARSEVLKNEGTLVPFNSLSITGGILDAAAAVKKAIELTKK